MRYLGALVLVAAAAVLRFAMEPWLDRGFPFLTFYAVLPFAALYGGLVPGLVATLAAGVVATAVFMSGIHGAGDVIGLVFFEFAGTAFAVAGGRLHGALGRRQRAEIELREALALRDEFLSIAAHELRTPLAALTLQLDSLARTEDPTDRGRKLERARRQTARLAELIQELLTVGRISTGRLELVREDLDLAELVRDVVTGMRDAATQAGSRLTASVPASAAGRWDRLRLEQVLGNLIDNAIKYGAGQPVEVTLTADLEHVTIQVRDHGMGIAPEKVPRVFDRFERGVSAKNFGGLGLGLYITKQIVDAHGGTIVATSTPGDGASFTVTLPR